MSLKERCELFDEVVLTRLETRKESFGVLWVQTVPTTKEKRCYPGVNRCDDAGETRGVPDRLNNSYQRYHYVYHSPKKWEKCAGSDEHVKVVRV